MALGHGGARKGAGRKPGATNRATRERQDFQRSALEAVRTMGKSPLEIMMLVAQGGPEGEAITDRQLDAAKAAAPYYHPRKQSISMEATVTSVDPETLTDAQLAAIAAGAGGGGEDAFDASGDAGIVH